MSCFKWVLAICFFPFCAGAVDSWSLPLHQINAGTKLVPKQEVFIPANSDQITLSTQSGAVCKLRVRERKPFDRVLVPGHPLVVEDTYRSGFSSAHRASMTTYVLFRSKAVEDLACVTDHGAREMTLGELQKAVSPLFSVDLNDRAVAVVD